MAEEKGMMFAGKEESNKRRQCGMDEMIRKSSPHMDGWIYREEIVRTEGF